MCESLSYIVLVERRNHSLFDYKINLAGFLYRNMQWLAALILQNLQLLRRKLEPI